MARLSDQDRRHLAELLQNGLQSCETSLRERFRQVFKDTFEDVGLKPRNPPEKVALNKVTEELLDRIVVYGFLTFSDLRDTLSRNQLKLPDLSHPRDFILGDPLLRLDRRLATLLDGVYRRSEFYLRWLERLTALNFGTKVGRLLTLWVTLPFGMAFMLIEGFNIIAHFLIQLFSTSESAEHAEALKKTGTLEFGTPLYITLFAAIGLFIMALFRSEKVRHTTWHCTSKGLLWLRFYVVQWPMSLVSGSTLKSASNSWPVQLFYWYAFKPLVLFLLILVGLLLSRRLLNPYQRIDPNLPWWVWAIVFLVSNFLINSRPGQAMTNTMSYSTVQLLEQIRAGLLPRLFNFVVVLFKNMIHLVDKTLFQVDEWLLFRKGDSQQSMMARMVMNVFWFPISYLTRFNLVVFVEPFFNPLKLPVCTIAYKFYLPIYAMVQRDLYVNFWGKGFYVPFLIGSWINFWFADVFGFIFWEVKENWRLYRENRSPTLGPVSIGPHGESLAGLLQPGFHSGTVPRLYHHLREAERLAHETGKWSGVRTCHEELSTVADTVRLFLVRDFVALLDEEPHWRNQAHLNHQIQVGLSPHAQEQGMKVGKVRLGTNQVRIELIHPQYEETPVQLEFTSRGPWLLAGFGNVGWLQQLSEKEYRPLHNALIMLYKLAGVDLVREQLHAALPPEAVNADLSSVGICIRLDGRPNPVIYNLLTPSDIIAPQLLDGLPAEGWPTLHNRQLLFKKVQVTWDECIRCWQPPGPGKSETVLLAPDVELMPRGLLPEMQKQWRLPGPNGSNGSSSGSVATVEPETNGKVPKT